MGLLTTDVLAIIVIANYCTAFGTGSNNMRQWNRFDFVVRFASTGLVAIFVESRVCVIAG